VNPENDPRYRDYWGTYHELMARRGVTPDIARAIMRTNTTAIAAVMVHRNEADSMICGTFGQYLWHLGYVRQVLARGGLHPVGALSLMILEDGPLFIADTHVHPQPSPEQIMETVIGAARHVRRFGLVPKIALCTQSQFGNMDNDNARRMRGALELLDAREPDFAYEGEMNIDAALDQSLRDRDGDGEQGAYRDAVHHRAGFAEHLGLGGHACGALRLRPPPHPTRFRGARGNRPDPLE